MHVIECFEYFHYSTIGRLRAPSDFKAEQSRGPSIQCFRMPYTTSVAAFACWHTMQSEVPRQPSRQVLSRPTRLRDSFKNRELDRSKSIGSRHPCHSPARLHNLVKLYVSG